MRKLAGLFVFIGFFLFQAPAAHAAGEDVFVVARVPVQAQAESATAAKGAAQATGRRRAMDILLRRLTPENDWAYLPNLAAGTPATAASAYDGSGKTAIQISPRDLEALESGFEVYGEKTSSTTYRALITYRFKPDAVRRLLKNAGIPYSEAQTRVALVLPVLQTDSGVYLWESNNPWMAAWKSRPYTHELTPLSAPLGDLEDSSTISARQALALDAAGLQQLADRYSVSQVIVAHARLRQKDGVDQLTVRLINGHRESGKALESQISPDDILVSDDIDTFGFAAPDEDFAAKIGEVVAQTYLTQPSGNFPALAEQSIDSVIANYASGWKQRTLIDHSKQALLPVTAFFDRAEDWSKIRSALIATPLVGSVQVSSFSRRGAEMDVRVFGDPSRVQVALENQGVVFWTETGDRWFLGTPAVAGRYRGKRFLRSKQFTEFGNDPQPYNGVEPVPVSDPVEDQVGKIDY
ncbi:MAG: DUF2066 domain-containing protein [Parvularculaceae bacterium]